MNTPLHTACHMSTCTRLRLKDVAAVQSRDYYVTEDQLCWALKLLCRQLHHTSFVFPTYWETSTAYEHIINKHVERFPRAVEIDNAVLAEIDNAVYADTIAAVDALDLSSTSSLRAVFVPHHNHSKEHWTLSVILPQTQRVLYIDSCEDSKLQFYCRCHQLVKSFVNRGGRSFDFTRISTSLQHESECGARVVVHACLVIGLMNDIRVLTKAAQNLFRNPTSSAECRLVLASLLLTGKIDIPNHS